MKPIELNTGDCVVMQKQFWRDLDDYDIAQLGDGSQTLAISAFVLSQLPTPVSRKQIVKEMWESPAQTIVRKFPEPKNMSNQPIRS